MNRKIQSQHPSKSKIKGKSKGKRGVITGGGCFGRWCSTTEANAPILRRLPQRLPQPQPQRQVQANSTVQYRQSNVNADANANAFQIRESMKQYKIDQKAAMDQAQAAYNNSKRNADQARVRIKAVLAYVHKESNALRLQHEQINKVIFGKDYVAPKTSKEIDKAVQEELNAMIQKIAKEDRLKAQQRNSR